jgi:uncharacterized membrane protein YhaH (DUF805 family)
MNWYLEVWKKYAVFTGRAQRAEFWYFTLFNIIIGFVLGFLDGALGLYDSQREIGILSGIYSLAVFIPSLAVSVRRLHDIGKSGWWLLFFMILMIFIPFLTGVMAAWLQINAFNFIGIIISEIIVIYLLLIVWFATDSQPGENKYGKNPKEISNINEGNTVSDEKKEINTIDENNTKSHSEVDELLKWSNLLEKGLITQEEFEEQKKKILNK